MNGKQRTGSTKPGGSTSPFPLPCSLLVLASTLFFGGCGVTLTGIGVGAAAIFGNAPASNEPAPPSLVIFALTRAGMPSATEIPLAFSLVDPSGAADDVDVSWRSAAGDPVSGPWSAATAAQGSSHTGLSTSPTGVAHTFVWGAQADLAQDLAPVGVSKVADVVVRLVPRRGGVSGTPVTLPLRAGETPPTVNMGRPPAFATHIIGTDVTIADDAADPVTVSLFAWPLGATPSASPVPLLSPTGSVATSPAPGQVTRLFWDSITAPGIGYVNVTVTVDVVVADPFGGIASTTTSIFIHNNALPQADILSVGTGDTITPLGARIPVRFALFDAEADENPLGPQGRPSVSIEYSADGGSTFVTATGLVVRELGRDIGLASLSGLRARPIPIQVEQGSPDDVNVYTFLWDALADGLGGAGPVLATIRVAPRLSAADIGREGQQDVEIGQANAIFSPPTPFTEGWPIGVAVGDVNGDLIPDLVLSNQSTSVVDVRLGLGAGLFSTQTATYAAGVTPQRHALVDVNGDGILDIVVPTSPQSNLGELCVFLGDGAGGFVALPRLPLPEGARGLAVADLDGDGFPDLVVPFHTTANALVVYRGDGRGGFAQLGPPLPAGKTPRIPVLGDLDGDGLLDIVVPNEGSNDLTVYRGTGNGSFTLVQASLPVGRLPTSVALGDWNGDGIVDLAVTNENDQDVGILLGTGGAQFGTQTVLPSLNSPVNLATADLDSDALPDLVTVDFGSADVNVRLGLPGGRFGTLTSLQTGNRPLAFALFDLDGDGVLDFALGEGTPGKRLNIRFGMGGGGLSPGLPLPSVGARFAATLGDVNGDGVPDLVTTNFERGSVSVYFGTGRGSFRDEERLPTSNPLNVPFGVALGDLNGDGIPDIVVADYNANGASTEDGLSIFLGSGGGAFAPERHIALAPGTHPGRVALGDLNGDGILDMVVADDGAHDVRVFLGIGGGSFATGTAIITGLNLANDDSVVALGDINGDGVLDVAVTEDSAQQVRIAIGHGDGTFSEQPPVPTGRTSFPRHVVLADVDGDGILDLVTTNLGARSHAIGLRLGIGGGAFGGMLAIPTGGAPGSPPLAAARPLDLVVADLDGDGVLDLATVDINDTTDVSVQRTRPGTPAPHLYGPARRRRGDGWSGPLHFSPQLIGLGTQTFGIAAGDVAGAGLNDLVAVGTVNVQSFIACPLHPSRAAPELAAFTPGTYAPRRLPASPIDLGLVSPPLTRNRRYAQASLAESFVPEGVTLTTPAPVTLTLRSWLTQAELAGGTFRVFRFEQSLGSSGAIAFDPRFGVPVYGRVVEVARRDPSGAQLPPPLVPATVDPVQGTITFAVDRLSRYQAFLEAATTTAVLYRETFDAAGADSIGLAPLPPGWFGSALWQSGAPSATALALGQRPAPASAPSLLAIGLRNDYVGLVTPSAFPVTTTAFMVGAVPAGRSAVLRLLEWHDLGAGDAAEISLLLRNTSTGARSRQLLTTLTGTTVGPVALAPASADATAAITAGLAAIGNPVTGAEARLELRVRPQPGSSGRGWFVDDLELRVE